MTTTTTTMATTVTTRVCLLLALALTLLSGTDASAGAIKSSPFLSRSEAHTVLGRKDIGRYKALTASLGLRADISDGWEELLRDSTQDPVSQHIDLILQKNYLSPHELRHLAERAVFRSPVALGYLNNYHVMNSQPINAHPFP